jgi:hypothetical protein
MVLASHIGSRKWHLWFELVIGHEVHVLGLAIPDFDCQRSLKTTGLPMPLIDKDFSFTLSSRDDPAKADSINLSL